MKIISIELNSQIPRNSVANIILSFKNGSVIYINVFIFPQPSIELDSYTSSGIDCNAANILIAKNGTPLHNSATTTAGKNVFELDNHAIFS